MNLKSNLGILRLLAVAEGISYLLFALTMPIKYMLNNPMPNKIVGMAHGVLFIAYCIWVILVGLEKKWNFTTLLLAGFASLIPFGTFIADSKIFKKQ
jgi:integral membrane protein